MKKPFSIKVLVLSLAVVTALTAAFAAQASAKKFVTDDGNIACIMRSKFVRCDVTVPADIEALTHCIDWVVETL